MAPSAMISSAWQTMAAGDVPFNNNSKITWLPVQDPDHPTHHAKTQNQAVPLNKKGHVKKTATIAK